MAIDNQEKIAELLEQLKAGNQVQSFDEEEEIDWQAYINKVWKGRKLIILVTIIFMFVGLAYALTMKRTYNCTVTLAPEVKSGSAGGSLGGLASMLGMGGMATGSGSDALGVSYYPNIVSSTPFLTQLMNIHVADPKEEIDTTLVGYINGKPGFSIMKFLGLAKDSINPHENTIDIFHLTQKQNGIVQYLSKAITAEVDKKTGEITVSVTMGNPVVAATVADSVCSRLQAFITDYRTKKAREDLAYYQKLADEAYAKYKQTTNAYAYYQDHNHGLILNSVISEGNRLQNEASIATQVYTQMKQQAELARGKVQEDKPIFAVIQPASVPLKAENSRAKVLMMFTFIGFALSVVWTLFGPEYFGKAKQMYLAAKNAK